MGCLVVTDNKIGLEKLFKINKQIVIYRNLTDLVKKIQFYLKIKKYYFQSLKMDIKKLFIEHNYKNRVKILDKMIKKNINIYEKIYSNLENFHLFIPNLSFFFSSSFLTQICSFIVILLFARNYTALEFGKFTIAQTIFFFFTL